MDEETFKATLLLAGWRDISDDYMQIYELTGVKKSLQWHPVGRPRPTLVTDYSFGDVYAVDGYQFGSFTTAAAACVELSQEVQNG